MKKRKRIFIPLILMVLLIESCGGTLSGGTIFSSRDINPPVLLDYTIESDNFMIIYFDEPSILDGSSLIMEPSGKLELLETGEETSVKVHFLQPCLAGKQYKLRFDVADARGNSNWFIVEFYSPNRNLPRLVINEFSSNGSSSRPDMVEFYVSEGGNTAGMTLLLGTRSHWKSRYLFPDIDLSAEEYVVFHCRPEGLDEEVTEVSDNLDESGGKRAVAGVRDLWPEEDMNLSGTNGVLTLLSAPLKGSILDRVIYSNRVGDDDKYKGWTSSLWPQVCEIMESDSYERGWCYENFLYPEEAARSDSTTSTRTLCRSRLSVDSDQGCDWHTVPGGACSFGEANTDEVYE